MQNKKNEWTMSDTSDILALAICSILLAGSLFAALEQDRNGQAAALPTFLKFVLFACMLLIKVMWARIIIGKRERISLLRLGFISLCAIGIWTFFFFIIAPAMQNP
ncbi:MAG: hypothetical protein PHV93_04810 [Candidatus Pacebacteria bacterium]|nr:hypothetical protein [Candidatus Paceibacterota bacterium]